MSLQLMYITNDPKVALLAEDCGVDRIFLDLETIGKEERQKNLDTVKSKFQFCDIALLRRVLTKSQLLVRINKYYEGTKQEVNRAIADGADVVMLPYFKTVQEVKGFLDAVKGKAKTCLLFETAESVEIIDELLDLDGIDEIHIGLNDLHLEYGMEFMFQLLANGSVERLCNSIAKKGISYGFGGVARMGCGELPSELIISEHYRLGSERVILSRAFCNAERIGNFEEIKRIFESEVKKIRGYEEKCKKYSAEQLEKNRLTVIQKVNEIVEQMH